MTGARVPSSRLDDLYDESVVDTDGLDGADRVEVSGSGFSSSHPPSCRFGAVRVSSQWTSAEQVWCASPSTGSEDVSFAVTQGTQHQVSGAYTYAAASDVHVRWATPARVPASGGATVTVHGSGVSAGASVRCSVGGSEYAGAVTSSGAVACTLGGGLSLGFTEVGLVSGGRLAMGASAEQWLRVGGGSVRVLGARARLCP